MRSYQQPAAISGPPGYAMPPVVSSAPYGMPRPAVSSAPAQYQVSRPITSQSAVPFQSAAASVRPSFTSPAAGPVISGQYAGARTSTPVQSSPASLRPYTGQVYSANSQGQPGVRPITSPVTSSGPRIISASSAYQPQVVSSPYQPQVVSPGCQPQVISPGYQPQVISSGYQQPQQPNVLAGPSYTVSSYEKKHEEDMQLQNLKEIRRSCGLKDVPVREGLETMQRYSFDGKLTRDQFLKAYAEILARHSIGTPDVGMQNAVFDLFDRDGNHVVDMMELICGISLLCSGSEDDKIQAVFEIFDVNGDGYISMDEMFKFLTSVFKVVLTPNVMAVMNSMGVEVTSAEDLASVTSMECFKTADLNHDSKLSLQEFKSWFYAPRHDPSVVLSPVQRLLQ